MAYINRIALLFALLLVLASCRRSHVAAIKQSMSLADSFPDRALNILDSVRQQKVSDAEQPLYALAYTMALGKKSIEVDDDSLLRIAYNYYSKLPNDSLYGRCMYYMGNYFHRSDSDAKAIYCLKKSIKASVALRDTNYWCNALRVLSESERYTHPKRSLAYLNKSIAIYNTYSHAIVYNKLAFANSRVLYYAQTSHYDKARAEMNESLKLAEAYGDTTILADGYMLMALIETWSENGKEAVKWAERLWQLRREVRDRIVLAESYSLSGEYEKCVQLLRPVMQGKDLADAYKAYSICQVAAVRKHDEQAILAYTDSATNTLEVLFRNSLDERNKYYSELMQKSSEKRDADKRMLIYVASIVVLAVIIVLLVCMWRYKRAHMKKVQAIELDNKNKELALQQQLAEKGAMLHKVEMQQQRERIDLLKKYITNNIDVVTMITQSANGLGAHIEIDENGWEAISNYLENADDGFVSKIRRLHADLGINDLRFLMLVRIGFSTKTLAQIYCINEGSVKQRLLKYKAKLNITDSKMSVREYVTSL